MNKANIVKLLARVSAIGLIVALAVFGQGWVSHICWYNNFFYIADWYITCAVILLELTLVALIAISVITFIIWEKS